MQSIEHRCYLVEQPTEWWLELDLAQHLGSHRCRLEHCSVAFEVRWLGVGEDQEELLGD
jgi:hypothetical protein